MRNILRKETFVVLFFCLMILLPAFDMLIKVDRFKHLYETRELAKAPHISLTVDAINKFPTAYTNYFNDHFGFRNALIRVNFIIRYFLLGESPSNQVVIGKKGWLFFAGDGEIEDYRGITKYNENTLKQWAVSLEMKRIWLEKQGIHYIFVVVPNKSTIYGEFLPKAYNRVRQKTGLDELIEYLKKHTSVEVVDLRPTLLSEKNKYQLYDKRGTHWNDRGAFLAYLEIMKPVTKWFPSLRMQAFNDYRIESIIGDGNELSWFIGGTEFIKDEYVKFTPLDGHSFRPTTKEMNTKENSPVSVVHNETSLPRAIVFRDSFFSNVAPFISEHFQYSKYYWEYWNSATPIAEMVKEQKPDIIIEQIVERYVKTGMADFLTNRPKYLGDIGGR